MQNQNSSSGIMAPSHGIAREGYPFIAAALVLNWLIFWLLGNGVGVVFFLLPAFVTYFFRDPERKVPQEEDVVVSPGDGKVIGIEEIDDQRYTKRRMKRVTIFLSVFNVHVNRVPVSGRIREVRYNPGKFLVAYAEKSSLDNEQNGLVMEDAKGRTVVFVQIAGLIARRIVCYLKGGESVTRGERFGLIRFGSRVDVYLPLETEIRVNLGDKVVGAETVLAKLR